MRIRMQDMSRRLRATHKGHTIYIEWDGECERYYIEVTDASGCFAYDGWAPEEVQTMEQAKKEALYGSGLEKRPTRNGTGREVK